MYSLEEFYYQVVFQTPPADRYHAVQEIQDVIVVNFDCVYDRECVIRGTDQLLYLAHKIGHNKRFLFISEDGANLSQSGAVSIISNIVNCFNLNEQTCAVICREDLQIPSVSVFNKEAIPYWCRVTYPNIKDIAIPSGPFAKKFAIWINRGTFYRLDLVRYLLENHLADTYISYQQMGMIVDAKLSEYFQDELNWAKGYTPIVYDQLFPNQVYNLELILGAARKPYADYFLEITAETDILSTSWITEKTVKNLYIGKPFILMGGAGSLAKIRSFGFQSFSPWIDESYDSIGNIHDRLNFIKREITRLSKLDLNRVHQEILPILKHNRQTYEKYINCR